VKVTKKRGFVVVVVGDVVIERGASWLIGESEHEKGKRVVAQHPLLSLTLLLVQTRECARGGPAIDSYLGICCKGLPP